MIIFTAVKNYSLIYRGHFIKINYIIILTGWLKGARPFPGGHLTPFTYMLWLS